jgi:hypothetical protein
MHLKCRIRRKDGKVHRTWSIVESRRVGARVMHKHVLYLGEISDEQKRSWEKAVEVIDETTGQPRQMELLPEDRAITASEVDALQVRLSAMSLRHPRQWGACWLADSLWRQLRLETFFGERLGHSREGTDWEKVLRVLTIYRLLSPGSEWRLHRQWSKPRRCRTCASTSARYNPRPCTAVSIRCAAAVCSSARALERSVRGALRGLVIRPHQHLLRVRRAGLARGSAPVWVGTGAAIACKW